MTKSILYQGWTARVPVDRKAAPTDDTFPDAHDYYVTECGDGYYAVHERTHDRAGPFTSIKAAQRWIDTGESDQPG